jgi:hypothetical protein
VRRAAGPGPRATVSRPKSTIDPTSESGPSLHQFDINDGNASSAVFALRQIDVVLHFGTHAAVGTP